MNYHGTIFINDVRWPAVFKYNRYHLHNVLVICTCRKEIPLTNFYTHRIHCTKQIQSHVPTTPTTD